MTSYEGPASQTKSVVRKSRAWQYSLKALVTCLTFIAIAAGLVTDAVRSARQRIGHISRMGAKVLMSDECDDNGQPLFAPDHASGKPLSALLNRLLPRELLYDVAAIDLSDTNIGDKDIERVVMCANTRRLYLDGTKVTDAGIRRLSGMKRLEFIGLERTAVTEVGFDALRNALPGLKTNRDFEFEQLVEVIETIVPADAEKMDPRRLNIDP